MQTIQVNCKDHRQQRPLKVEVGDVLGNGKGGAIVVRVGSKKTNWIRQLECTTPFAPLHPRLKQLLWLYR
jgi:hypothetical protein